MKRLTYMRQLCSLLDDAQQRTERAEQPEGDSSIVQPHQPEMDGQRGVRERLQSSRLLG